MFTAAGQGPLNSARHPRFSMPATSLAADADIVPTDQPPLPKACAKLNQRDRTTANAQPDFRVQLTGPPRTIHRTSAYTYKEARHQDTKTETRQWPVDAVETVEADP